MSEPYCSMLFASLLLFSLVILVTPPFPPLSFVVDKKRTGGRSKAGLLCSLLPSQFHKDFPHTHPLARELPNTNPSGKLRDLAQRKRIPHPTAERLLALVGHQKVKQQELGVGGGVKALEIGCLSGRLLRKKTDRRRLGDPSFSLPIFHTASKVSLN